MIRRTQKGYIPRVKTIVVGYEATDASERALLRAADFADAFSAHLVVVSVGVLTPVIGVEPAGPMLGPALAPAAPFPPPEQVPDPEELAQRRLERARSALAGRSVEADYVAEIGDPAQVLLEVAERRDADLIVVGSREHGLLERLLVRAVDEAVAQHADRDVLLVH
jgi:nucleotide-binding universal stress UspA family protein